VRDFVVKTPDLLVECGSEGLFKFAVKQYRRLHNGRFWLTQDKHRIKSLRSLVTKTHKLFCLFSDVPSQNSELETQKSFCLITIKF
jgi:hypothetical protein